MAPRPSGLGGRPATVGTGGGAKGGNSYRRKSKRLGRSSVSSQTSMAGASRLRLQRFFVTTEETMETQARKNLHPLMAGAAVAVIIAAGVAVAAITGHLPGSKAETAVVSQPAKHVPAKQHVAAACHDCGLIVEGKAVDLARKSPGIGAVARGGGRAVIGHEIGENRTGTAGRAVVGAAPPPHNQRPARAPQPPDITLRTNHRTTRAP